MMVERLKITAAEKRFILENRALLTLKRLDKVILSQFKSFRGRFSVGGCGIFCRSTTRCIGRTWP